MSGTDKPEPQPEPPRQHVRRRAEQDPEMANLIWLQETRAERLADARGND